MSNESFIQVLTALSMKIANLVLLRLLCITTQRDHSTNDPPLVRDMTRISMIMRVENNIRLR